MKSGFVTINDLKVLSGSTQYTGINVGNINSDGDAKKTSFKLNLDTVTIDVRDTINNSCGGYPLKIGKTAQYIDVKANKLITYGWGGIQSTSNGVKLVADESEFNTINIVNSESHWNYFSAIVVSQYYDNGAGNSENNDFTFNDCKFVATTATNNKQKVLDIRSPYNNFARLNNCTFTYSDPYYMGVCFASNYGGGTSASAKSDDSVDGKSAIYVDGVNVTYTANYISNYLDGNTDPSDTKYVTTLNDYAITYYADPFPLFADELGYSESIATVSETETTWSVSAAKLGFSSAHTETYNFKVIDNGRSWTLSFTTSNN